ncbi:MAG: hypothetical protein WDZ39_00975 [Candidatus Spechtbacterales bacterium]
MYFIKKVSIISLIIALSGGVIFGLWPNAEEERLRPETAEASVGSWQKAVSVVPEHAEDFSTPEFRQSMNNLSATGANHVSLIIPYYQSNRWSTDVQRGGDTPTDESLISAINYIHSLGMSVTLKPHMETFTREWRAYISPDDRDAWFAAYGDMLNHYAELGEQHGVEQMIIGSELISMAADNEHPTNTQNWINLIQNVRNRFSGNITYSANWGPSGFVDEKNDIAFWSELDSIGIAAYFTLGWDWNNYEVETLKARWDEWNNSHIKPLQQQYNKPVLFTELGYRSLDGAHTDPWDSGRAGGYNGAVQANAYDALFSYWDEQNFMVGVHLWNWRTDPNAGGEGNTRYTPQNKPAQDVMTRWFRNIGEPSPPSDSPAIPNAFSVSASTNPAIPQPGQNTETSVEVMAGESGSETVIVNIEMYNGAEERALQHFFFDEFAPNQTRTYSFDWSPAAEDDMFLSVGIFSQDWSMLHQWNHRILDIPVRTNGEEETPPEEDGGLLNTWWPTDGATISGVQPFKAILEGQDVSSYLMFWQVDGDRLNEMRDSFEEWPHKRADVDVSGWSWRDSGPYAVNFVAKTLSGTTIAERLVNIFVR